MGAYDLIEKWVRDDAPLNEIKSALEELDPLKNIKTKEEALAFIQRNDVFASALDAETTRRGETRVNNFREKELASLEKQIRDDIAKELNPEETPEQKKIRELTERINQAERDKARTDLVSKLRAKASELNMDQSRIERYAVYGESAIDELVSDHEHTQALLSKRLDETAKQRYAGGAPKAGKALDENAINRIAYENMEPLERANFMRSGGSIVD